MAGHCAIIKSSNVKTHPVVFNAVVPDASVVHHPKLPSHFSYVKSQQAAMGQPLELRQHHQARTNPEQVADAYTHVSGSKEETLVLASAHGGLAKGVP
ncbi:hypothetical protein HaLaN_15467 [Haematococcus lacustris]|uniref:Uncharacterized protein n=1 Tax=Haematococcus lacustris TaxID=44745 RepID=A0A699ZRQ3_HAELA|nr:hypothetical protein HaLaN_15467 [Haematococcus lacustris]